MSHAWQIEQTTLHDTTDVTIRNVKTHHTPLRLDGSAAENTVLIQLLRYAGFAEETYPYQCHHTNDGWGPQVEGLGIVIRKRCRNGHVPAHADLYALAVETEQQLKRAAQSYAPFARYLASPVSQVDLSPIEAMLAAVELTSTDQETAIEQLQGASQQQCARIEQLVAHTTTMAEEISELQGNVGEVISTQLASLERRTTSKLDTIYETLYHTGNGALSRIGSLEATRQDTLETLRQYDQRLQQLGEVISRIAFTLHEEPSLERSYLAAIGVQDGNELYEEQIELQAAEEREAQHAS